MKGKVWLVPLGVFVILMLIGIFQLISSGPLFFLFPIGMVGFVFAILWGTFFKSMFRNSRVLKTGEPGTAKVVSVSETGITINNNPVVKLGLEVTPQNGSTYATTAKVMVSRLNPMMYGPGRIVQVKIDPSDKMFVAVDPKGEVIEPAAHNPFVSRSPVSGQASVQRNAAMTEILLTAERLRTQLLVNGKDAQGTLLSLWSLDVNIDNRAVGMEFLVEAEVPGMAPFKVEIKGAVANENISRYVVGNRVLLKYDPADPVNRITLVSMA